jgi:outer membrane protein assembly factor BamB
VGQGHSAASIKNGLFYTQGSRSIEKNGKKTYEEGVFCFNAVSGQEIWHRYYVTESRPYTGPRASPVIDESRVYALGAEGNLLCLDAKTGNIIWEKNLIKDGYSRNSDWGFCGSPLVVGSKLILDAGSSGMALDKKTGAVIWKSPAGKCGLGTPVLTAIGNKKVVLINNDRYLFAVNVSNGNIVWKFPWPNCDADPVLVKDKIFLFGGKPGNQRCRTLVNIADGKSTVSWPERKMNLSPLSWIAYKGYVYGITYDKKEIHLKSISLSNGAIQWEKKLNNWASLTISNNFIILIQTCGDLVILRASPDSYDEVSRVKIWQMKNRQNYPNTQPLCCWTAPVLCNGKIYVRNTYGEIACIDVTI